MPRSRRASNHHTGACGPTSAAGLVWLNRPAVACARTSVFYRPSRYLIWIGASTLVYPLRRLAASRLTFEIPHAFSHTGSDQEKTFGPTISGLIHRHIEPERLLLWDSKVRGGRPDTMKILRDVYHSWNAEGAYHVGLFRVPAEQIGGRASSNTIRMCMRMRRTVRHARCRLSVQFAIVIAIARGNKKKDSG